MLNKIYKGLNSAFTTATAKRIDKDKIFNAKSKVLSLVKVKKKILKPFIRNIIR